MIFDIKEYKEKVTNCHKSLEYRNKWAGSVQSLELMKQRIQDELDEAKEQLVYWCKKAKHDSDALSDYNEECTEKVKNA